MVSLTYVVRVLVCFIASFEHVCGKCCTISEQDIEIQTITMKYPDEDGAYTPNPLESLTKNVELVTKVATFLAMERKSNRNFLFTPIKCKNGFVVHLYKECVEHFEGKLKIYYSK